MAEPKTKGAIKWSTVSVDALGLDIRGMGMCQNYGIRTVGDLIQKSAHDLLKRHNFGKLSLARMRAALAVYGLRLRDDGEPAKLPAGDGDGEA